LAPENGWLENDPFLLGLGAARQVQAVGFQGIQHMGRPVFFLPKNAQAMWQIAGLGLVWIFNEE